MSNQPEPIIFHELPVGGAILEYEGQSIPLSADELARIVEAFEKTPLERIESGDLDDYHDLGREGDDAAR